MHKSSKKPKESEYHYSFLKNHTLRVDFITTAFVSLLIITVLIVLWHSYRNIRNAVLELSGDLINQVSETVIEKTTNYLMPASLMSEMSSRMVEEGVLSLTDNENLEIYAIEVLKTYPQLAMFNIGDEQGNFLMPKKLPDGTITTKIIDRTASPPTVTWKYRDDTGKVIKTETSTDVKYDPRGRPWYTGASKLKDRYWTDMYILFTDQKPGITAAYPVVNKSGEILGVFSLDIELGEMSNFLKTLKIGKTGVGFIINSKNEIVAYPDVSRIVKKENGRFRPVNIDEMGESWITSSFRELQRNADDHFLYIINGKRYIGSLKDIPESFGKDWKIAIVAPATDFIGKIKETNQLTFLMSIIILIIAVIVAIILSRSLSKPIVILAEETRKMKDFKLDDNVDVSSSIMEIQSLSNAISAMKTGLRTFKKYVPAALVRQLIHVGEEARIGGKKKELTIFFSDIAGFTSISEIMPPEALMLHLSEYLDELTGIVMKQTGTIDKFIGDGIMGFWGAPIDNEDQAFHACNAALLCQKKVRELNRKWRDEGKTPLPTRIGINTGEVIVGNMGSSERMNYSVLGDNVNLAKRLEGINRRYGTRIIVSQATYEKVSNRFLFRPLDIVTVKGKKQEVMIYELAGIKDGMTSETAELCKDFTRGFNAYHRQDRDEALRIFNSIIKKFPDDRATTLYIERCSEFNG